MRRWMFILFILLGLPTQASANDREVYIALGDSLAAGQTPYSQIDAGYTDFIALQLERQGRLAYFSKELTFPGYRVSNVIETVKSEQAQALLKEATVITISAGANDLLPLIAHNPQKGTMNFSQLNANFALNHVREQMDGLLQLVQEKAPNADVYVMGYYFPYVSVHNEQMAGATAALQMMNDILKQQAIKAGASFVDVYDTFEQKRASYLPNVSDVHPNQLGYLVMANAMLKSYSGNDAFWLSEGDLPPPNPKSFEELLEMQEQVQGQTTVALHLLTAPRAIYG